MTELAIRPPHRPEPWATLPPEIATLLKPELPSLADEIVRELRRHIPEFARPLQGNFGTGIRLGVEQGLAQFVNKIADPRASLEQGAGVYRALGSGEFHEGRSLDALQAAYRMGARAAWRRFAMVCQEAAVPAEMLCMLAEAVFAHIDEIAALSVEGYVEAQARAAGVLQRRRRRLLESLVASTPVASDATVLKLARSAGWPMPKSVACVVLGEPWHPAHLASPAVSPDVLMDLERADPYLLVPDPDGPGRGDMLRRAFRDTVAIVGPSVPLRDAALSLRLARRGLRLHARGAMGTERFARCEDHLATLLLLGEEDVMSLLTERNLAPFATLSPLQRERLSETLLVWLEMRGSVLSTAQRLYVHPQTVRYRLRQLELLFGSRLRDPDGRLELQVVLRTQALLTAAAPAAGTSPGEPPQP